jgi:hypothetical protein
MGEDDISQYRAALRWLLDFKAANIPPPSSIIQNFWNVHDELNSSSTYGTLGQTFQSILAFPIWLFNANNYGNTDLLENQVVSTLPPEFYTTASVVEAYSIIRFNPIMYWLFLCFEALTLLFVWVLLLWGWLRPLRGGMPALSSFGDFDAVFKTRVGTSWDPHYVNVWNLDNAKIIKMMKDGTVYAVADLGQHANEHVATCRPQLEGNFSPLGGMQEVQLVNEIRTSIVDGDKIKAATCGGMHDPSLTTSADGDLHVVHRASGVYSGMLEQGSRNHLQVRR